MSIAAPRRQAAPPVRIEEVLERLEASHGARDLDLVRRAYVFSGQVHRGQQRLSGEPYLSHPLAVALILAEMGLDPVSVAVGLLHDVLEDTGIGRERLAAVFGPEVAGLVEGVTKIGRISFRSREQEQAENFRKLLLAMVQDIRVLLVKLADRLHNVRTLQFLPAGARRRIAGETLDIYVPLAHRLGMGRMQAELEDLAFRHWDPERYVELERAARGEARVGPSFVARIQERIAAALEGGKIPGQVEHRIKSIYSLHRKLVERGASIDQVYDLLAFRIITETVQDCYAALGQIHSMWRPLPGRFKDFIAMPKPNMYRSLHTTLLEGGQPFEVQIRTRQMHRVAEEGIAAHWLYKEGRRADGAESQPFQWLRQIVEWQREVPDAREFLSSLKLDLYPEEVYVFTPKGDVKAFPRGATAIDFAYAVHTEVGHHCVGARINGRLVPLRTPLRNGDIVEILTAAEARPNRDWLRLARTSRARSKIRGYLNRLERARSVEVGRRLCDKELRKHGGRLKDLLEDGSVQRLAPQFGLGTAEDLLAAVGYGKVAPRQVAARLLPDRPAEGEPAPAKARLAAAPRRPARGREPAITVEGIDDILVTRARCCGPVPGEAIVGYVTRGRGVSVHAAWCPNLERLLVDPERRVPVVWKARKGSVQPVALLLEVEDRQGLLADITGKIADEDTNIRHIESRLDGRGRGRLRLVVDITDLGHLQRLTRALPRIRGVRAVRRLRSR